MASDFWRGGPACLKNDRPQLKSPTTAATGWEQRDWRHEALEANGHDPAALRFLARSSVRLGHDDTAIGIYTRRLAENAIEPEDLVLWGVAQNRRGLGEPALVNWNRAWKRARFPRSPSMSCANFSMSKGAS